jgi:hypothetical protein
VHGCTPRLLSHMFMKPLVHVQDPEPMNVVRSAKFPPAASGRHLALRLQDTGDCLRMLVSKPLGTCGVPARKRHKENVLALRPKRINGHLLRTMSDG